MYYFTQRDSLAHTINILKIRQHRMPELMTRMNEKLLKSRAGIYLHMKFMHQSLLGIGFAVVGIAKGDSWDRSLGMESSLKPE